MLIWFKYNAMHIFMQHLSYIIVETTAQIPEVEFGGKYWYLEGEYGYLPCDNQQ